jgi:pimeloyl-ACP methyl ester carboxylesterase
VNAPTSELCTVSWAGHTVQIEHQWIAPERTQAPLMVFLHEGLGSVSMWRDFPTRLCDSLGWRGLVYSRPGYGKSTPRAADEHWAPDFMHQQALEVLPALLDTVGIDTRQQPPWLFGHSDGGSIALIHAAWHPKRVAGAIVLAPHIFVEDISVRSIAQARAAFEEGDLRERLSPHHNDPDSAFHGWSGAWLSPEFSDWNLAAELSRIGCPLLAVQGVNDEYGTRAQIYGIASAAPQTQLLEMSGCGHSPHRDQPEALISMVQTFVWGARTNNWTT